MEQHKKGKSGTRKYGRNSDKSKKYQSQDRRVKNKKREAEKRERKFAKRKAKREGK